MFAPKKSVEEKVAEVTVQIQMTLAIVRSEKMQVQRQVDKLSKRLLKTMRQDPVENAAEIESQVVRLQSAKQLVEEFNSKEKMLEGMLQSIKFANATALVQDACASAASVMEKVNHATHKGHLDVTRMEEALQAIRSTSGSMLRADVSPAPKMTPSEIAEAVEQARRCVAKNQRNQKRESHASQLPHTHVDDVLSRIHRLGLVSSGTVAGAAPPALVVPPATTAPVRGAPAHLTSHLRPRPQVLPVPKT